MVVHVGYVKYKDKIFKVYVPFRSYAIGKFVRPFIIRDNKKSYLRGEAKYNFITDCYDAHSLILVLKNFSTSIKIEKNRGG